jgi:hypothetical protein
MRQHTPNGIPIQKILLMPNVIYLSPAPPKMDVLVWICLNIKVLPGLPHRISRHLLKLGGIFGEQKGRFRIRSLPNFHFAPKHNLS